MLKLNRNFSREKARFSITNQRALMMRLGQISKQTDFSIQDSAELSMSKSSTPSLAPVRNKFQETNSETPRSFKKTQIRVTYQILKRVPSAHSSLRLHEEPGRPHRKPSQGLRSGSATKLPNHTLM